MQHLPNRQIVALVDDLDVVVVFKLSQFVIRAPAVMKN